VCVALFNCQVTAGDVVVDACSLVVCVNYRHVPLGFSIDFVSLTHPYPIYRSCAVVHRVWSVSDRFVYFTHLYPYSIYRSCAVVRRVQSVSDQFRVA
jgi:hypothetical protein